MIDTEKLDETFRDCLYNEYETADLGEGQIPAGAVVIEGIVSSYGFHPVRLESHRQEVFDWLAQLPQSFRKNGGGGWSFLGAPFLEAGEQWGEHRNAELLLTLGMALGLVKCQLPRELWASLPGGMPYYVIDLG